MIVIDRRTPKDEGYATVTSVVAWSDYIGIHLSLGYYLRISYEEFQEIIETLIKEAEVER